MDRGAWQAIYGVARVGHGLVTSPPPPPVKAPWLLGRLGVGVSEGRTGNSSEFSVSQVTS